MQKYSKFIIAAIGLVLMGLNDFVGLELGLSAEQLYNFAVPVLTAVGVWGTPNEAAPKKES